jgi:hypothetical protein
VLKELDMNIKILTGGLLVLVVGALMLVGCSRVEEPWTSGYSPPKNQLVRTPAEQKALRDRLIEQSVGLRQLNE